MLKKHKKVSLHLLRVFAAENSRHLVLSRTCRKKWFHLKAIIPASGTVGNLSQIKGRFRTSRNEKFAGDD